MLLNVVLNNEGKFFQNISSCRQRLAHTPKRLSHLVSNYQQFVMAENRFIDTLISLYDLNCAVETSPVAFASLFALHFIWKIFHPKRNKFQVGID